MQHGRFTRVLLANAFSVVLFLIELSMLRVAMTAQSNSINALQATIAKVEQDLDTGHGPLTLVRMPELEDNLLGSSVRSQEVPFFIYRPQLREIVFRGGQREVQSSGGLMMPDYLAISRNGEKVYRLGGFPEAEEDFSRLILDYHIGIPHNRAGAQSRALYCARVVFGIDDKELIWNEDDAKRHVKSRLSGPDESKDAGAETRRWWHGDRRDVHHFLGAGPPDAVFVGWELVR
jgi:hypothetical protein